MKIYLWEQEHVEAILMLYCPNAHLLYAEFSNGSTLQLSVDNILKPNNYYDAKLTYVGEL